MLCHRCWAPSPRRGSEATLYCLFWDVWHQKSSGQYIITMCNLYTNAQDAFIVQSSCLEKAPRSPKTQDKQNNNHRSGQRSTQLFHTSVDYGRETPAGRWVSRSSETDLQRKIQENHRTTEVEGWNGMRICYSLAGLPHLDNWGNQKGIVLNLHRSPPLRSTTTLRSSLKYTVHRC